MFYKFLIVLNNIFEIYSGKKIHNLKCSKYFKIRYVQFRKQSSDSLEKKDIQKIPVDRIRNFSIIAHVDHGKSTLADRLLELTGAISKDNKNQQILDSLQVERERGITVKAQTVSLYYQYQNAFYLLNLIDTPGHVDFANEVSRSLSACDGVILLVDACHGVQAQTVSNYYLAKGRNLTIVPVLNKIDIKHANPERVRKEMETLFGIQSKDILEISAKLGIGINNVLDAIIGRIPPPKEVNRDAYFRALTFDSWYDRYRGALNLVYVKDGSLKIGDEIQSVITGKTYPVKSISILRPVEENVSEIHAGEVGLVGCNMRNSKESIIGDTLYIKNTKIEPLDAFKPQQAMVYAGIYPTDQSKHVPLRSAIEKLALNDSAVTVTIDSSPALGQGWRLGFLGLLHMEVFCQRLEQEYNAEPIITAPSVTYKLKLRNPKLISQHGTDIIYISNAALFPDVNCVEEYMEPFVLGTIITPTEYVGSIISLCVERRGLQEKSVNIDNDRILMKYILPLSEVIIDFHDKLKAISSGYASFNYTDYGYHTSNVVKMNILLNSKPVEEMCRIVHVSKAVSIGREMVLRLKDLIPRQMIQIAVQACVGSKILARETIKPYRKDVTAKLYGGDVTRRMKLLKQQAEGKKKMRMVANIRVPNETFINVLKK